MSGRLGGRVHCPKEAPQAPPEEQGLGEAAAKDNRI